MKEFEEERLRSEYTPKEDNNVARALKIEKKMKLPAYIFAYTFGILGALILGIGMCFVLDVFGNSTAFFISGIIIGIVGIIMVSTNYPLYNHILKKRKEKYASAILVELNRK